MSSDLEHPWICLIWRLRYSKDIQKVGFMFVDSVQATTGLVDTVLVETTVLVEQNTLTMQFYSLIVESPL